VIRVLLLDFGARAPRGVGISGGISGPAEDGELAFTESRVADVM